MPIFEKSCQTKNTIQKSRIPSCMNLILASLSCSFQITTTFAIKLSDFYKLVVTGLKLHFLKQKQNVSQLDYKQFRYDYFRTEHEYNFLKLYVYKLITTTF